MDTQYKVVTEGKLREGVEEEHFVRAFAQTFKVPEDKARKLLAAGRAVTLKDNLDKDTAEKFRRVLEEQIGLQVVVEAKASPTSLSLAPMDTDLTGEQAEEAAPDATGVRCPKCGSDQVVGDDCLACGIIISRYLARQAQAAEEEPSIYAAPTANVVPDKEEPDDDEFGLRKVDAGSGWHWLVGGWRHFVANPVAWIVALIIWYLIVLGAGLIPFIGSLAVNILSPVFIAGFMLGASEQERGGDFTIQHVFAGFSTEFGKLVQAGLLYLVGGVIVGLVIFAFIAMSGFTAFLHQAQAGASAEPNVGFIMLLILVAFILMAVMSMAFWFVPLLVVFDGVSPIQAIPMSFSACWKNALAFLIYGLVAFGLALVAMIPVGLGLFVFAPVMMASIYVAYREIFHGAAPAA
jgi:uncharacterized membrane protein